MATQPAASGEDVNSDEADDNWAPPRPVRRRRQDLVASVLLALLIVAAIAIPVILTPGIACVGIINVIRYVRDIRDGFGRFSTFVLMFANGLVVTIAMVVFLMVAAPR